MLSECAFCNNNIIPIKYSKSAKSLVGITEVERHRLLSCSHKSGKLPVIRSVCLLFFFLVTFPPQLPSDPVPCRP